MDPKNPYFVNYLMLCRAVWGEGSETGGMSEMEFTNAWIMDGGSENEN